MRVPSASLAIALSVAVSGCVERAQNVSRPPESRANTTVAEPSADAAGPVLPLARDGDGGVRLALEPVALRPCDDGCLRRRGLSFLRVLRLAHRTPDRIRTVLMAFDLPYSRLWMAWLSHFAAEDATARTELSQARALLSQRQGYEGSFRGNLAAIAVDPARPTLGEELVAEMRTQLEHWATLSAEFGTEAALVRPCVQLAREGAATVRAFRARGPAEVDDDVLRVVTRCARVATSDALPNEPAQTELALQGITDSVLSLAPRGAGDPRWLSADTAVRARLSEPLFVPTVEPEPVDDRAVLRAAGALSDGGEARRRASAWLRERSAAVTPYARLVCTMARRSAPTLTDAQCNARATRAVNAAAKLWLEIPRENAGDAG